MTNDELVEFESTKAELRDARAELAALKERGNAPPATGQERVADRTNPTRIVQIAVLLAIVALAVWQMVVTIQLRSLLS